MSLHAEPERGHDVVRRVLGRGDEHRDVRDTGARAGVDVDVETRARERERFSVTQRERERERERCSVTKNFLSKNESKKKLWQKKKGATATSRARRGSSPRRPTRSTRSTATAAPCGRGRASTR